MSREPFDAANTSGAPDAQNVTGNAFPVTARRTSAQRVAAFRAARARFDVTTSKRIGDTVHSLAAQFDTSDNAVINSLIRSALTNRNWRQQGLWGGSKTGGAA